MIRTLLIFLKSIDICRLHWYYIWYKWNIMHFW